MTAPAMTETVAAPPRRVVLVGAKGGVGTTMLATNLAAWLSDHANVCLADFDFCKGDVGCFVDVEPPASLDALLGKGDLDAEAIGRVAWAHPAGFHALCQPHDLSALRSVDAPSIRRLLDALRDVYGTVIVDAGSRIDVPGLSAMLGADLIVLVTTNQIPSLRDAQRVQSLLGALEVPSDTIKLVVNAFDPAGVSLAEVQEHLARPVTASIPFDPVACRKADLDGSSVLSSDTMVASAIKRLWPALRGEVETVPTRGFWPWSR